MYKLILIVYLIISIGGEVYAAGLNPSPNSDRRQAESLNVCSVGYWPSEPALKTTCDEARNLVFLGSSGCVYVLDVSDPENPTQLGDFKHSTCQTCGFFYEHSTQRLYITDGVLGLEIWDLVDPSRPLKLGEYDTPGYACDVSVSNFFAYVADGDAGLRVIDVSKPSNPQELGYCSMTSDCCVYIAGSYAYVGDLGLRILDISEPKEPQEIAYYDTPGIAFGVQVVGAYAYVADDWFGLRVIDVSTQTEPHEVGYCVTPGYAWDVYVSGSFAYIAACDGGLRIIDVSTPT